MKLKANKEEKEQIKKELRELLDKAGRKIFVNCRSVSPSGMSRKLGFNIFIPNTREEIKKGYGKVTRFWLTLKICKLLDYPFDYYTETMKIKGCGMDMGFAVVYNLGGVLYPKGDGKTITGRNGNKNPETNGGFLLKHELL